MVRLKESLSNIADAQESVFKLLKSGDLEWLKRAPSEKAVPGLSSFRDEREAGPSLKPRQALSHPFPVDPLLFEPNRVCVPVGDEVGVQSLFV
ncbi:hypothetical protein BH09ACT6_BH09ACT6_15740 [soil metagenome]